MTELVQLNLALSGAILAVFVLRRPVRAAFGPGAAYALWLLAPAALLAVLVPPGGAIVMRLPEAPQPAAPASAGSAHVEYWPSTEVIEAAAGGPTAASVLLAIWIAGVLVSVGLVAWRQGRFVGGLGGLDPVPGRSDIRRARTAASGPALMGLARPKIILPADFEQRYGPKEQAVILAHEEAHLARGDSRINAAVALVQCLSWYNPLVHLAARALRVDQELACDETVIARRPKDRRVYAEVLLKSQLAEAELPLGCYWPPRAERPLKARLAMLAAPQKPSRLRRAGFGAALLAAGLAGAAAWAAQPPTVLVVQAAASEGVAVKTGSDKVTRLTTRLPADTPGGVHGPEGQRALNDLQAAAATPEVRRLIEEGAPPRAVLEAVVAELPRRQAPASQIVDQGRAHPSAQLIYGVWLEGGTPGQVFDAAASDEVLPPDLDRRTARFVTCGPRALLVADGAEGPVMLHLPRGPYARPQLTVPVEGAAQPDYCRAQGLQYSSARDTQP